MKIHFEFDFEVDEDDDIESILAALHEYKCHALDDMVAYLAKKNEAEIEAMKAIAERKTEFKIYAE